MSAKKKPAGQARMELEERIWKEVSSIKKILVRVLEIKTKEEQELEKLKAEELERQKERERMKGKVPNFKPRTLTLA